MTAKYKYVGPVKSKKPLVINDKKALWLMRMIVGEGGRKCSEEKAAVLCWAITNRWFLWPGRRYYRTFIGLMRAFSQPINPRWMTGGDLARKYFGRRPAAASRLRRRARMCALKRRHISLGIIKVVSLFQKGELPMPKHLVDGVPQRFSNWASLKNTKKNNPHGFDVDGDWTFEDRNLHPGVVMVIKD